MPGEELRGRRPEGHVDGIQPVDRRQQVGRSGHPGADVELGPPHTPRDLGAHVGVVEVLLHLLQGGLGRFVLGPCIVHVLLRDRVLPQQRLEPLERPLGVREPCQRGSV